MNTIMQVFPSRQPRRPHYIQQWAEERGLTQSGLAEAIEADKGQVSRWYSGSSPSYDWQIKLAAFFHCDRDDLFRHPDEVWLYHILRDRDAVEIKRIKDTLQAAFPRAVKGG